MGTNSSELNWLNIQIGEITDVVAGGTPKAGNPDNFCEPPEGIAWLTPADLSGYSDKYIEYGARCLSQQGYDSSSAKLMPAGSILFSSRAPIGYVAIASREISTNQGFKNFVLPKGVDSEFAYYYLRSIRTLAESLGTGTTFKEISGATAKTLPFILPPLAEQKVIAEKLDKLLAKVDSIKARLDAVPDILKRFRQSVLSAAVSGKLTEEWRSKRDFEELTVSISEVREKRKQAWIDEQVKSAVRKGASYKIEQIAKKYKEPTEQTLDEFDLTLIKQIPEEWVSTNLDSVSIAVTGKTPKTTEESYWNGDIPFISPSQITNEGYLTSPERHVTQEGTSKTTILPSGSIMIVCIGTIGKVGLVDKEVAFNQQINALIPTQVVLPEFLFFWSKTLHSWLNKTSSAVVNAAIINKSRLCTAPCPLPSIAEQTEIVRRVEKLFAYADKVEAEVNAAQERVNKLTQSILAKAFRGELTAKWREQNPELISGDNSAEALLASIQKERKAEREKLKPKKKTRTRKAK